MTSKESKKIPDLQKYIGCSTGPYYGWDRVNPAMIRHWCAALGDRNPIYSDRQTAKNAGFSGIVAPPAMLQAWTMPNCNNESAPNSDSKSVFEVLDVLEQFGYTAIVAVNCEQEYDHYLAEGDELRHFSRLDSISEEKSTALGSGFFVTEISEYFNQRDERVGKMLFRVFKFRPHPRPENTRDTAKPPTIQRMRPVRNQDNAFFWEGVEKGDLLFQKCSGCGTPRHPPGPVCPRCHSLEWESFAASGKAILYSYVQMHEPQIPPFRYPNLIALAELAEGVRLVAGLEGIRYADVRIGMPLHVHCVEVEKDFWLPCLRPTKEKS